MTMTDKKCDVCHIKEPIGVASTMEPMSVAYCEECARRHAQPECIFIYWEETIPPKDHRCPDQVVTYSNGNYINYRKWYNNRRRTA